MYILYTYIHLYIYEDIPRCGQPFRAPGLDAEIELITNLVNTNTKKAEEEEQQKLLDLEATKKAEEEEEKKEEERKL